MTFEQLTNAFGVSGDVRFDAWKDGWQESLQSFAPDRLTFMEAGFVRATCARLRISREIGEAMVATAADVRANSALAHLAWHLHRRMVEDPGLARANVGAWPLPPRSATPSADLFMALLFLACVPQVEAFYGEHDLPESVFFDTMADFELWIREYRRKTGRWGLDELRWLVNHFTGNLFRLGRLQFQFGTFHHDYHAFRHRRDARVLLLAGHGIFPHPAGWAASGSAPDTPPAPFREDKGTVHGWPVHPGGRIVRAEIQISTQTWQPILQKETRVLNIHIPAGSPMDFEACGESFRQAMRFFPKYFPDFAYRAFACGSWLLDPQLEDYLPETSNIRRFLAEFYLYPLPGATGGSTVSRVLGGPVTDLDTAPQDTSLQRAVVAHLKAGKRWREGGSLLFPEDFTWGAQVYRRKDWLQAD